jgi:hypothetical protein
MTKTYTCPVEGCGKQFTSAERQGKNCPCGKVEIELKQRRREDDKGFEWYADLAEGAVVPKLNGVKPKGVIEILSSAYGQLVSTPGELPYVFLRGAQDHPAYTVIYVNTYLREVYCPNPRCRKLMFRNTTLRSSMVAQEHKCRQGNCRADVAFIFTGNLMDIVRYIQPETTT